MSIPAEAVEALARVLAMEPLVKEQFMDRERARRYLEAAAPYIRARALEEVAADLRAQAVTERVEL